MKNVLIATVVLLLAGSCLPNKKDKDPQPDLAGTYQITSYDDHGTTIIPYPGVSGQITVVKDTDTQISVSILVRNATTGKTASGTVPFTISKASGSSYDLVDAGTSVGSIDGTTFTLSESDNTGSSSISAKK